jgi:hypothetical protein
LHPDSQYWALRKNTGKFACDFLHDIRFDLKPLNRLNSINAPRWLLRRLAPAVLHEIDSTPLLEGIVTLAGKSARFCYDIEDRPFYFDLNALWSCDRYFKAQMPRKFPEPFQLSRHLRFPYPATVLECADRIRPAMLGRPLARSLDARKNRVILHQWRAHGTGEPAGSLFAYFGGAAAEMAKPLVMDMGRPHQHSSHTFSPKDSPTTATYISPAPFGHPNQKRVELVRLMRSWNDPKVDARILSGTDPSLVGPTIPRQLDYARKLAEYDWNCNITGLFGSIPFRFADAFALGRGVITDELTVKWYQPFDYETEIRNLGAIGYEVASEVDWPHAESVLRQARVDSDSPTAKDRRAHIKARYEQLWSPLPFARYVVGSCLEVL